VSRGGHRGHNVVETVHRRESEADCGYGPICLLLFGVEGIRINDRDKARGHRPPLKGYGAIPRRLD
jgi:hypothetical protein